MFNAVRLCNVKIISPTFYSYQKMKGLPVGLVINSTFTREYVADKDHDWTLDDLNFACHEVKAD